MSRAETAARTAIKSTRAPTPEMRVRLGVILKDEAQYVESETILRAVLPLTRAAKNEDLYFLAVRALIECADGLKRPDQEKSWFSELVKNNGATAWDWDSHAARLHAANDFKGAGDAYSRAAGLIKIDWCLAGTSYEVAGDIDAALQAERQCIEKLTGTTGYEKTLAWAHYSLSSLLNERGVYPEALSHAKEATVLDPSNAWAFSALADSLFSLRRFNESASASKEAIRLSDGKYAVMHFRLAASYFETENWQLAAQSFKKAAELEPTDDASAYNVALCYTRLDYYADAVQWYEEVLRRNPNRNDKEELKHRIQILRR
jgi:tetratricopeptide (TPR) repeat protein